MSAHFVCAERTFRYLALPPSLPGTERPPFYLVSTHGMLGGGQFSGPCPHHFDGGKVCAHRVVCGLGSERRVTCLAE